MTAEERLDTLERELAEAKALLTETKAEVTAMRECVRTRQVIVENKNGPSLLARQQGGLL